MSERPPMIFDSITHVTPDGRWFNTQYDASESSLLAQMDAARVQHAVVVPLAGFIPDDYVLHVCNRNSSRLLPGASFDPVSYSSVDDATDAIRRKLKDAPYRVLKLHPRLNRYDPLDARCMAILEEMSTWDHPIPVWIDTLLHYRGGVLRKSIPDTLHEIVCRFPNLDFVLLHSGGSWVLQLAQAVADCTNVLLDVSFSMVRYASSSVWQDLRYIVNRYDRCVVFGSDFPEIGIPTALDAFQLLADGLPSEKRANVLGGNLSALLMGNAG